MPESIIYLPKYKSINVHPSLLPQYRGPSPLQTMILDDCKTTGISIMLMDKDMDHGDILCQKVIDIKEWMPYEDFELFMAKEGGRMLIDTIPQWIKNKIEPKKQDHDKASFTKKIEKENGLMDIFTASQYDIYRKYCAFHIWPSVYFEISAEGGPYRIKIKDALWKDGKLIIKKVVRENGKEISYSDFILSLENDGCLHEDQKAILRQYSAFE
jgi:methionyl-tRNA formyltransferase